MPTLFLIDGHALAYRTYFALTSAGSSASQWVTKAGEPTAGTYGFTAVLLRLIEQDRPDYLAVSFDVGRTFRDDWFPEYKGTREKMPDDLRTQLGRINEVVTALNIPIYTLDGYEADDVLGTLARQASEQGVHTVIVTGDRDLLQLASENVTIRLPGKKLSDSQDYRPADVKERFGVEVSQFVDYKALVGDSSDNIPGVAGIGEKSAISLLTQFPSLEAIYQNLDSLPKGQSTKLSVNRENAFLSQRLSRIVTDAPIRLDLNSCQASQVGKPPLFDRERVSEVFRTLEFRSLLSRINELWQENVESTSGVSTPPQGETRQVGKPPTPTGQLNLFDLSEPTTPLPAVAPTLLPTDTPTSVTIVDSSEKLAELVGKLGQATVISFDTETTGTDPMQAQLVGIALATHEGSAWYIPVGHKPEMAPNGQLPISTVISALRPALTHPAIGKVAHNAKYDYIILARYGVTVSPLTFDTLLAEWLCDPGSHNLGLKNLAWVRLNIQMTEIKELIGTGAKQISMAEVPVVQAAPYAAADVDMTLRLMHQLQAELQEKGLLRLLQDVEMPLVTVLASMEMQGVKVDSHYLAKLSVEMASQLSALETAVHQVVGYSFNLNSTQQLGKALFEDIGIVPPKGTKKLASGGYSTAAEVLEDLAEDYPVVQKLLEYRELSKLKSTYVDALPRAIHPQTGRIHTSYSQAGSVTGRLASSEPNLQNIPIRTEQGRQVRRAFVATPGNMFVSIDYSQIELRVAAHFSDDEFLRHAFLNGQDIHTATAAAVFNVKNLADVTRDQRRQAKAVNFGLLYGMGAFRLARETGITLGEAEVFIETYFARLPGVKRYLEETLEKARSLGYVETALGRKRYFPVLQRPAGTYQDKLARQRAEREAINSPIQGTAADMMKLAMLAMHRALPNLRGVAMLLQVHDELVFECPASAVDLLVATAKPLMENAFQLRVPVVVEAKAGTNWNEMTKVG
ncbi:MAG TPA: DNA polymerase I [Anaerolineales bacterium]|nr:DNA polymerase I [Anaerolineales bacterium]